MQAVDRSCLTILLAASASVSSCAAPPPMSAAVRVERLQCDPASGETQLAELLSGSTILGAEPRYSHIMTSNNNSEERIRGAKILMRPPEGVSAERMPRLLQCHGARAVLGRIDPSGVRDDPFWLPNVWVEIVVKPENGNYAVTLETDNLTENIHLAALAVAFAQDHGAAAISPALE
jgi:hypothetical protein